MPFIFLNLVYIDDDVPSFESLLFRTSGYLLNRIFPRFQGEKKSTHLFLTLLTNVETYFMLSSFSLHAG